MKKDVIELMKDRIKKIDEEMCPVEVKQQQKERLERLEKERLEKERLEKNRRVDLSLNGGLTYLWDGPRGYSIDFNGTFLLHSVFIKSTDFGNILWINNNQYSVTESQEGNWYKLQLKEPILLSQANISVEGKKGSCYYYTENGPNMRPVGRFYVWSTNDPQNFSRSSNNTHSLDMILELTNL